MTKKEVLAYRRRWKLMEQVQRDERRGLSIEEKLKQLDLCYQAAAELGFLKQYAVARCKGKREVQLRWRRLKGLAA
jgi:hypothetical protein